MLGAAGPFGTTGPWSATFPLAPLAGNENIWVEMRMPECGAEAASFLRPLSWVASCPCTAQPFATVGSAGRFTRSPAPRSPQCLGARRRGDTYLVPLDGRAGRALRHFRRLQPGDHRAHRAAGPN